MQMNGEHEGNNGTATAEPPQDLQPAPPATPTTIIKKPDRIIVSDSGINAELLDTGRFDQCYRVARVMSTASLTPKHLRQGSPDENIANCFLVVMQGLRWNMDPFAIMGETYVVGGKLGFQGKLVAAVINSSPLIGKRLDYKFSGQAKNGTLAVKVIGRLKGETEDRDVDLTWSQAKTTNQMWTNDPEQKLCYSGAIRWARRHCPEIILGVRTDDDLERMGESIPDQDSAAQAEQRRATSVRLLRSILGGHMELKEEEFDAVCIEHAGKPYEEVRQSEELSRKVIEAVSRRKQTNGSNGN